ncbi:hypothetical protein [Candidatus Nitrosocosmicus hydrocola]|uniref:hypothetical protein n=1 Tax=Candidatus Nitrosocosmicus hydrocola TaxID=1826872 RepID=UPI0011E5FEB4|nr:hypothetical protein [Candidatus Nitrosocosmicus hydrocola]
MEKSSIILILFILFTVMALPANCLFATDGNESFVNQDMIEMNINTSSLVYDLNSKPFNISYADWTEKWWQWTYSIPWDRNPSYDDTGEHCDENQNGPVWFLTQGFEHPVERTCNIPQNTALLITLLNSECSYAEFRELKTEEELRECANNMQDFVIGAKASLNNITIPNVEKYRIQTDLFNFTLPKDNILNLTAQTTQAVADGNWLFLKPLPPGKYELKAKGEIDSKVSANETGGSEYNGPIGWNQTTTYNLLVVDSK